jgi:hypothetical protein
MAVDPSEPHHSRELSTGKATPVTLVRATDRQLVRMKGSPQGLQSDLPADWLPAAVGGTIKPDDWLKLVFGRLLVEDKGALFQPVPPASVAVGGVQSIRGVIDPALWVDVPAALTKDGNPFRARAIRPASGESGRPVSVELSVGRLAVELMSDSIQASVRFEPWDFTGESPAELKAQVDSSQATLHELQRDADGIAESIEWVIKGTNTAKKSIAERDSDFTRYLQILKERELAMLVDSRGIRVEPHRKAIVPGAAPQVVLPIAFQSVRGWDAALGSLRKRIDDDALRLKDRLAVMRQDLKELQERLAKPVGAFMLLGDDGYVIANVTLLPAQPPAASAKGGANP